MYTSFRPYLFNIYTACSAHDLARAPDDYTNDICKSGWNTGPGGDQDHFITPTVAALLTQHIINNELRVKVQRLLIAIERSISFDDAIQGSLTDVDTLRVFIVPEFYFRSEARNTTNNEYTAQDYASALAVLMDYFQHFDVHHNGRVLKSWVFLCGTAVFTITNNPVRRDANMMPVFTFDKEGHYSQRTIRKMYTSNIDGVPWNVDLNATIHNIFGAYDMARHYLEDFSLFVEICLEHGTQLMARYNAWHNPTIRCHVISAAGMTITDDYTLPNTDIFRTDGMLYNFNLQSINVCRNNDGHITYPPILPIYTFNYGWTNVTPAYLQIPATHMFLGNVYNPMIYTV